jgi:hypothetical protein
MPSARMESFATTGLREDLERETGFEPATSTLARSHSTAELLPLCVFDYKQRQTLQQRRQLVVSLTVTLT